MEFLLTYLYLCYSVVQYSRVFDAHPASASREVSKLLLGGYHSGFPRLCMLGEVQGACSSATS